jgi:cell division inhibitor SepF
MSPKWSKFLGIGFNEGEYPEKQRYDDNKVVSINDAKKSTQVARISIYEPRIYADVKVIAKQLIDDNAVIINFGSASDEATRRIIDFLNGVIFTIDGSIERISELVFVFTPHNYHLDGETRKSINERMR